MSRISKYQTRSRVIIWTICICLTRRISRTDMNNGYLSVVIVLMAMVLVPRSDAEIVLDPSRDVYIAAVQQLNPSEQKTIGNGWVIKCNLKDSAPSIIGKIKLSRIRPDTPTRVDINHYSQFLNDLASSGHGNHITIQSVSIATGVTYDQTIFGAIFRIDIIGASVDGQLVEGEGFGGGPMCSRFENESYNSTAVLIRNTNIAFMKAFLKALLSIRDKTH